MRAVQTVETKVGELMDRDWLTYTDEAGEIQFVEDEESIKEAAKVLGITPAAVEAIKDALQYMAQTMIEALEEDLADIWNVANGNEGC